jgi:NAD(P)-dependent dehydrogenase (short-subunit alcohol dehydrogenase family)
MGGAVLVTGAAKGIGRACALRLDQAGFDVFAGVRKAVDGADLRSEAAGITPVLLDVTDAESIDRALAEVQAAAPGGLAGLVNNAGLAVAAPVEFLPSDELRRQLEVNVIGQVAVTRVALPLLRRGGGRVVNMGSIAGRIAFPFMGPYAASKFALRALTDALRLELRPSGLAVVLIEPGTIATPIWGTAVEAGDALTARLPAVAIDRYGGAIDAVRRRAAANTTGGLPPEVVAEVVLTALTTARPKPRYLVGRDAKMASVLEHVPDRLRDRILAGRIKRRDPGPATEPVVAPEP